VDTATSPLGTRRGRGERHAPIRFWENDVPVSALVLTLDPDPRRRELLFQQLARDPRISTGPLAHGRLPVVVETETLAEGDRLVAEELPDLAGVLFVDVVLVDFSDIDDFDEPLPRRRPRRELGRAGKVSR
jgi:hypothetical protein